MKDKKITFYTIYEEQNNDLRLINQFDTLQELTDYLNIKKASLKVMISKKQKIKDRFLIIKDYLYINDLL